MSDCLLADSTSSVHRYSVVGNTGYLPGADRYYRKQPNSVVVEMRHFRFDAFICLIEY